MVEKINPLIRAFELAQKVIDHREGGPSEMSYDQFMDEIGGPAITELIEMEKEEPQVMTIFYDTLHPKIML